MFVCYYDRSLFVYGLFCPARSLHSEARSKSLSRVGFHIESAVCDWACSQFGHSFFVIFLGDIFHSLRIVVYDLIGSFPKGNNWLQDHHVCYSCRSSICCTFLFVCSVVACNILCCSYSVRMFSWYSS